MCDCQEALTQNRDDLKEPGAKAALAMSKETGNPLLLKAEKTLLTWLC